MKKIFGTAVIVSTFTPIIALAATNWELADVIYLVMRYLNMILILLMAVAVVFFVYNIIMYYVKPNENRSEAHQYLMWSIIGFFVILSFWGIVNVLQNTFGLQNEYNRPNSWTSFGSIFPGGGGGGNPGANRQPTGGGNGATFTPYANSQICVGLNCNNVAPR